MFADDAGLELDKEGTRRIYHVTPTILLPGIRRIGVDPSFANGALKVSWWCEKDALLWAITKISARKSISVDQLSVCTAAVWPGALSRRQFKLVYTSVWPITPRQFYSAQDVLGWIGPDGEWKNG